MTNIKKQSKKGFCDRLRPLRRPPIQTGERATDSAAGGAKTHIDFMGSAGPADLRLIAKVF